jgi:hypothetical protein
MEVSVRALVVDALYVCSTIGPDMTPVLERMFGPALVFLVVETFHDDLAECERFVKRCCVTARATELHERKHYEGLAVQDFEVITYLAGTGHAPEIPATATVTEMTLYEPIPIRGADEEVAPIRA